MALTNVEVVDYLGLPQSIIQALQSKESATYQPAANEFLSSLINKICYQFVNSFGFVDPFTKYDGTPINYGDTIENIFVEVPRGYTFDKDATDPFTKVIPTVKVLYASINYEMQYCVTIQDALLRRACLNEFGFSNLINDILRQLTTGKNLDTYFATLSMLNNADLYANGFENIQFTATATDEEIAKTITEKIIDVTTGFELPSTDNNKLGVMTATNKEDILLIIRKDLYNKINLDYLAGVYNLSKIDLIKKIQIVESFKVKGNDGTINGEDLAFIVMDTKCFDNHVCLEDGGLIYNPKGKYTNHFMNLWKIMSFKYFNNARAFKITQAQE